MYSILKPRRPHNAAAVAGSYAVVGATPGFVVAPVAAVVVGSGDQLQLVARRRRGE
jgi:hypothetical protein